MAVGFAVPDVGSATDTGDQKGLLAAEPEAPLATAARLSLVAGADREVPATGEDEGKEERPNRGGSVTTESFSGVISAAKSSGHI